MEDSTKNNTIEETSTPPSQPEGGKETELEPQAHGGKLKRSRIPQYENFNGVYSKIEDMRERLPAFREFYMKYRFGEDALAGGKPLSAMKIVDMFNSITPPGDFFPRQEMYRRWRKMWEAEHTGLVKSAEQRLALRKESQIVNPQGAAYEQLEDGMMTLGAELANDAMETLRDTNEREHLFDDEVVVKRKQYALNVFKFVVGAAHSKAALKIKQQGEARETAGFMLDLLRRASAGNLSKEEVELLRGSVRTEPSYGNTQGVGVQ